MARFLTDADVNRCVGLLEMTPAVEEMLANYGRGDAINLTRRKIATPGGYLAVMGGALLYGDVLGVKTFTHTENGYSFQVSLYDAASGVCCSTPRPTAWGNSGLARPPPSPSSICPIPTFRAWA